MQSFGNLNCDACATGEHTAFSVDKAKSWQNDAYSCRRFVNVSFQASLRGGKYPNSSCQHRARTPLPSGMPADASLQTSVVLTPAKRIAARYE